MDRNYITKAQLFDLISEKAAEIWQQEIEFNGKYITGIEVCAEYPSELYCYDDPEYKREVKCIFHGVLYLLKEEVIDLLRGKPVRIFNKEMIEVLSIGVEE